MITDEIIQIGENRRTIRKYSSREVSDSLLRRLLEAAIHAPTTGNMQLYSVIVTRTPEGKAALAPAHFNQPSVKGCDAVLTFCADFNRFVRWCDIRNAAHGYDNFQALSWAILDATIVAQQFVTLAEAQGLGTCYLGTTTYNAPEIADALHLPKLVIPVATVTVGWPDEKPEDSGRLPLEAVVFDESYPTLTDEDIVGMFSEKESRDDSRRFVEENGKENLAQVFTDIRYTREANELFSKKFLDFIERQGFKLK